MWKLALSQFRYHGAWLAPLLLALLAAAVTLTATLDEARRIADVWSLCNCGFGIIAHVFLYAQEVRERRPLQWIQLPVTPRQVIGARLMVPLVLHGLALAAASVAIPLLAPFALDAESVSEILAINGLFLLSSFTFYLGEEVSARLAGNRIALWLFPIAFVGLVFFLAFDPLGVLPDLESPIGILFVHVLAAAAGVAAYRMFSSRTNFLVGTDPTCGMPVDWSRAE